MDIKRVREVYKDHRPEPTDKHRFYSVLVPFVEKDGELCLMFEVRARDMERDPGEICFPGGHMERGENPRDCAVRETVEETGISEENIHLIGPGDMVFGYANYTLFTYVAEIDYEAYLNAEIEKKEVDELFLMPVARFKDTLLEIQEEVTMNIDEDFPFDLVQIDAEYPWRIGKWGIPIYDLGERVVWGLTAKIVKKTISLLYDED